MAIADLFSTSFIFSLLIIIVLLGVLYAYFNYKLSEQDHKINSMFGLVRSMADEMSYLRMLNSNNNNKNINKDESVNLEYATQLLSNQNNNYKDDELISVSDNSKEEDEEEDEEDEDEEEEDEDEEDYEDDDSQYSHDSDSSNNNLNINLSVNKDNNLLILEEELNEIKTIHLEEPIELNCNFEAVELTFTSVEQEDIVDPNKINLLEELHNEHSSSINISELGFKQDFKKLPLNKLREIIVEKGLIIDASKLKKNEILKMLGEE